MLFYKFETSKKVVFTFSTIFSNCGFVGFPLVQGLFGNIGVFYTSIFTIPFNLLMFTYGTSLFSGNNDVKNIGKQLKNPPLLCTLAGIILFLLSIKLPFPILKTLESIGNMTTSLSMFIIGSMLADITNLKDLFKDLEIYYLSLVKLIIVPILCFVLLHILSTDKMLSEICLVLVSMPTASLIGVFAENYNGNKKAASQCVFSTTILSIITMPCILYLI